MYVVLQVSKCKGYSVSRDLCVENFACSINCGCISCPLCSINVLLNHVEFDWRFYILCMFHFFDEVWDMFVESRRWMEMGR